MSGRCVKLGLVLGLWAVGVACAEENPAVKPENRDIPRHKLFLERAKTAGDVKVIFIGDSITQGWEGAGKAAWEKYFAPFKPFNLGISGDRTQHVIWRLTEGGEIDTLQPQLAVIMIGTNNTAANTAEQIAQGITRIVQILREKKPEMKILLLGVFPRAATKQPADATETKAADLQPKIRQINALIAKLDDGKHVRFLDIGNKFLDASGNLPRKIMPDFLHLSAEGYEVWAQAVEPVIREMLK